MSSREVSMKEDNSLEQTRENNANEWRYSTKNAIKNHDKNDFTPMVEERGHHGRRIIRPSPYRMREFADGMCHSASASGPDFSSMMQWRNESSFQPKNNRNEIICDSSTSPIKRSPARSFFPMPTEKLEYPSPFSHLTPAEYLRSFSRRGNNSENGKPPSTAASLRSTVLDMPNREGSSFSTPRNSAARGKKRLLSISPLSSDLLDLNSIIRTSPNSLVAYVINNEIQSSFCSRGSGRNSSAASYGSRGSYGHLSASVSPALQGYSRQKINFATHQEYHATIKKEENQSSMQESCAQVSSSNFSATQSKAQSELTQSKTKGETTQGKNQVEASQDAVVNSPMSNADSIGSEARSCVVDGESGEDEEREDNLRSFQCMWKNCDEVLESQNELVDHVNTGHIQKNKRDCTCHWKNCSREEKPFKAMYMLVVHVRRHTGEKPHKCHYDNCTKAYSRLENLKTHLRSHTGERPYVCEVVGCQKAFSNASDRAKHQNRTHSTVKQYACKVAGCPKRYTDPSSLRKHMKTVHGTLPQPSKKFKSDRTPKKENDTAPIVKNDGKDQLSESKKQTKGKCEPVNAFSNKMTMKSEPDNNVSSSACCHGGSAVETNGYSVPSFNQQKVFYGNNGEQWSSGNVTATNTIINNGRGNEPNNNEFFTTGLPAGEAELQIQMPPPSFKFTPLVKPVEHALDYPTKESVVTSLKNCAPRRGSNTSILTADSSGIDTHCGSRRGSDISIQSHLSVGKKPMLPASPSPFRPFSPSRIRQTVIEGEVLENYKQSGSPPTVAMDNSPPDPITKDGINGMVEQYQFNQMRRLSSGYGSRQNVYFAARNSARNSPLPKYNREVRRASEGTLKHVGESNFLPTPPTSSKAQLRRGSEPANVATIIDAMPRRQSMSGFKPLPIPPSMQQSLRDESSPNVASIKLENDQPAFSSTANMVANLNTLTSCENSVMPDITSRQQWNMHCKQQPQTLPNNTTNNIPNSTDINDMTLYHLSTASQKLQGFNNLSNNMAPRQRGEMNYFPDIAGNFHIKNDLVPPNASIYPELMQQDFSQNHMFSPPNINNCQIPNQVANNTMLAPGHQMFSQNHAVNSDGSFATPNKEENLFMYPQHISTDISCNEKHDFALQWRNNHFGQAVVKPDSTDDKTLESMMIHGMGALTTDTCKTEMNRPATNMTVNNMDDLLTSLVEENEYFENQSFPIYP